MIRRSLALLAAIVALAFAGVTTAQPALASQGSVPAEVRSYVATDLVAQLTDLYGPGVGGTGIDFDATTTGTAIWRVFGWSDEQLAGKHPADPLVLENRWAVPVSMADAPLGLAVVWINPDTDAPELASFAADATQATALAAVPDAASLVRDEPSEGWFALENGVLTPLVAGSSGLESPLPLADIGAPGAAAPADDRTDADQAAASLPLTIGIVVVLLAIVVGALIIPTRLARRRDHSESP